MIEHFAGDFPVWLSPVQVSVIPVSDKFNDYAQSIHKQLKENGVRSKIDIRNEKMGAKIRQSELNKIPIMIILGEKEVSDNSVSVRRRFSGNVGSINADDFIGSIIDEINNREKATASKSN